MPLLISLSVSEDDLLELKKLHVERFGDNGEVLNYTRKTISQPQNWSG
jgi:hypothetical protein